MTKLTAMRFASAIFALVMKFGGVGLLVIGILDSSYPIAPWGNDLLVIAMTARHPHLPFMAYYAAMSTVGSVLGCLPIRCHFTPARRQGSGAAPFEAQAGSRKEENR